tara:strand:- start:99 stop:374 length:276 start_codon:yes stop_codon:yes gene_type:complete
MVSYCRSHSANSFIVLTETGMMHRLTRELPEKSFIAGPTGNCACNDCRFMKMNTISNLLQCLQQEKLEILLEESIIEQAKIPIERMLDWSL